MPRNVFLSSLSDNLNRSAENKLTMRMMKCDSHASFTLIIGWLVTTCAVAATSSNLGCSESSRCISQETKIAGSRSRPPCINGPMEVSVSCQQKVIIISPVSFNYLLNTELALTFDDN